MSRWFRLDDDVINDPKILKLPEDIRWHWIALLCVASKHGGSLPSMEDVSILLRLPRAKANAIVTQLRVAGLLDETETGFAPHNWAGRQYKSDVSTERVKRFRNADKKRHETVSETPNETFQKRPQITEAETDTEKHSEANASGADAPPDPSEPERQFFARGKERGALGPSSGGQLAKLLKTCGGNVALARSKLELAITKEKPGEFIAGILRAGIQVPTGKPLTQHQIERQTTRDILDELDSFDSRSGQADPGLLRHDSGGRSAGIHGGVRRDVVQISASGRRAGD